MRILYLTENPSGFYHIRDGRRVLAVFGSDSFLASESDMATTLYSIYCDLKIIISREYHQFRNGDKLVLMSDPKVSWIFREKALHLNPGGPGDFISVCNHTVGEARVCAERVITTADIGYRLNWKLAADILSLQGFDEIGMYVSSVEGLALRWLDYVYGETSRGRKVEINRFVRFLTKMNHQRGQSDG